MKFIINSIHFMADFLMPKFLMAKMKSCEQTCVEIANDEKPKHIGPKIERIMHLSMCFACYTYSQQLKLVEKAFRRENKKKSDEAIDKIETIEEQTIKKFSIRE